MISNYYGLIIKIKICILPKRDDFLLRCSWQPYLEKSVFLNAIAIIPTQLKLPLIEVVPRVGFLETAAIVSRGDWL